MKTSMRLAVFALAVCSLVVGCSSVPFSWLGAFEEQNAQSDSSAAVSPDDVDSGVRTPYIASFRSNHEGWIADKRSPLEVHDGHAWCRGPWSVDYWHAPPGAGYLHLLMWIHTDERRVFEVYPGFEGNSFVQRNQSKNLTNAALSVRMRGDVDLKGAEVVVLVQAESRETGLRYNYSLTGRPFQVSPDWTEQTVILSPEPELWTCMGARHDRTNYGCGTIEEVLRDVNVDIIFILFPLNIVPLVEVEDMHFLQAGADYPVDTTLLPSGEIVFDWVRIDYPEELGGKSDSRAAQ